MEKLKLTEQQGEQIAALREEGLALRLEVEARRIAWEAAEQREKTVEQAAIMAKVFTYADDYEDENGNRKGERITDPADAWSMGKEVFMREYLPIVQNKWRELYGLEYPLNYSPTVTEYRRPYLDAQKVYRKIAVRFLRIVGHDKEADEMEKALNGYMRESLAQRLDEVNDRFIIGYAEAIEKARAAEQPNGGTLRGQTDGKGDLL